MKRIARSLFGLCLAAAVLSGCIPGEFVDSTNGLPDAAALEPGSYWVVQTAAGLDLFQMPAYRGDTGKWHSVAGVPEWFTQEGLYSLDAAGAWVMEMTGDQTDLDGLLQLWDPPPQVG
jgi:hypothetical protein